MGSEIGDGDEPLQLPQRHAHAPVSRHALPADFRLGLHGNFLGDVMSEWMPIETVPDDLHDIIGVNENGFIQVCKRKLFAKGVWEYFRNDEHAPGHSWSMIPTHWMPLPEPPKEVQP